ncbi:MAG: nuclear transport factor 2 family protein [Thiomicrorhabdus sp.]|nr:nuclear transport factor 2 family protein [Thiomicrorhabdus sp.]
MNNPQIDKEMLQTALSRYVAAFECLTQASLAQELAPLLSENIYFKDPFNQAVGKSATLAVFNHMFNTLDSPKFVVKHQALENDTAYLHWHFTFCLRNQRKVQKITGLSQVIFDSTGLVKSHIDYWDPAEQIYSQIPVLNWLIKQVAKRLSAQG